MSVTARPRRRSHCATSLAHEQLVYLHNHGCDQVQGYLFSRPVAAPDCEALIRNGRAIGMQGLNRMAHGQAQVGEKLAVDAAPAAWTGTYTPPTIATPK